MEFASRYHRFNLDLQVYELTNFKFKEDVDRL